MQKNTRINKNIKQLGANKSIDDTDTINENESASDVESDVTTDSYTEEKESDDEVETDVESQSGEETDQESQESEEEVTEETAEEEEVEEEVEEDEEEKEDCIYVKPKKGKMNYDSDNESEAEVFSDDLESTRNQPEIIVKKEERITKPILTKFERVRILGDRAKQLQMGAKPLLKGEGIKGLDPKSLAKLELENKVVPFKVKRVLPNNKVEIWDLKELALQN